MSRWIVAASLGSLLVCEMIFSVPAAFAGGRGDRSFTGLPSGAFSFSQPSSQPPAGGAAPTTSSTVSGGGGNVPARDRLGSGAVGGRQGASSTTSSTPGTNSHGTLTPGGRGR